MKRNFLTLFILVLVIALATCFMITGCQKKPDPETPTSSKIEKLSVPKSDDGSNDPGSVTSTPGTTTSEDPSTNSSEGPGTTSSEGPGTTSSEDPGTSSSKEDVRPSDTPIYNSAN